MDDGPGLAGDVLQLDGVGPVVIYDNMKIWRERLTELINELMNDEAVYRTAPATPGLLNNFVVNSFIDS